MCAGRNAFLFRPREDNTPFGVFERLKGLLHTSSTWNQAAVLPGLDAVKDPDGGATFCWGRAIVQSLVPKYSVWVVLQRCMQSRHENGQNEGCLHFRFQDILTWMGKVNILFSRFNSN